MKIYARFYEESDKTYRLSTLLQFGNSWDLIGSVVLLNPGSARPIQKSLDTSVLNNISQLIGEDANKEDWQEFSDDATIRNVEKLFSGERFGQKKELNGVIQLFNLFNVRNSDMASAVNENKSDSCLYHSSILNEIKYLGAKPVYLGWGRLYEQNLIKDATTVFNEVVKTNPYLNPDFNSNCFRHLSPMSYNTVKPDSEAYKFMFDFYKQL